MIISGLRPEHVSAEIKFQGFVARDFRFIWFTDMSGDSVYGDGNMVEGDGLEQGELVQLSREE